jgi:hypothetical protein
MQNQQTPFVKTQISTNPQQILTGEIMDAFVKLDIKEEPGNNAPKSIDDTDPHKIN